MAVKNKATDFASNKEFRKNVDIRQKVLHGVKTRKIILPEEDFAYGLPYKQTDTVKDLITNTYGNRAEEIIRKEYENFITEKSQVFRKPPKVIPRFISPKVEEMRLKEEEKKANEGLGEEKPVVVPEGGEEEDEEKVEEKPLYKLKMFQSVGSRVAEGIKKFKTYKPFKIKKPKEDETGIDKIINKVQGEIREQEKIQTIE